MKISLMCLKSACRPRSHCVKQDAFTYPPFLPPDRPHPGRRSLEIHKPTQPAVIGRREEMPKPSPLSGPPSPPSLSPFSRGGCCPFPFPFPFPTDRQPSHVLPWPAGHTTHSRVSQHVECAHSSRKNNWFL